MLELLHLEKSYAIHPASHSLQSVFALGGIAARGWKSEGLNAVVLQVTGVVF
jgi:hypothetical protein